MPSNAPHALGKPVQMILFVDSDHAGDLLSQRVHTRVLIFLNRVPILWYSIKQSGIEASSFGSEFMGLKVVTDLVKGLQYKLRMMGIPIEGPSQVQEEEESIAYHLVRENIAAGAIEIGYKPLETNLAYMLK
jgi:hypothetical protein